MVTLANLIMVLMGWTEVQCLVGEERLNSASFLIRLYGVMLLMLSYSQHRASSHVLIHLMIQGGVESCRNGILCGFVHFVSIVMWVKSQWKTGFDVI